MRGDATLFTRWDCVEAAWRAVMPILENWREALPPAFPNYLAGGQGPRAADSMLLADGREWRRI
jgi:glucose-6-phosphate 1-dehydrogenase